MSPLENPDLGALGRNIQQLVQDAQLFVDTAQWYKAEAKRLKTQVNEYENKLGQLKNELKEAHDKADAAWAKNRLEYDSLSASRRAIEEDIRMIQDEYNDRKFGVTYSHLSSGKLGEAVMMTKEFCEDQTAAARTTAERTSPTQSGMVRPNPMATPSDTDDEQSQPPSINHGEHLVLEAGLQPNSDEDIPAPDRRERSDSIESCIIVERRSSPLMSSVTEKELVASIRKRGRPQSDDSGRSLKRRQSEWTIEKMINGDKNTPYITKKKVELSSLYREGKVLFYCTIHSCPESGKFYILRCRSHNRFFCIRPWKQLTSHLKDRKNKHRNYAYDPQTLLEVYSVEVLNCTDALVNEYNKEVGKCANVEEKKLCASKRERQTEEGQEEHDKDEEESMPLTQSNVCNTMSPPLTDGTIYMATVQKGMQDFAIMVLPMHGDFSRLGIDEKIRGNPLLWEPDRVPKCYRRLDESRELHWAEGYGDGQGREDERHYPVFVLKNGIPKKTTCYMWLAAKKLKFFDAKELASDYVEEVEDFVRQRQMNLESRDKESNTAESQDQSNDNMSLYGEAMSFADHISQYYDDDELDERYEYEED